MANQRRIASLDSLRGIAAFSVVMDHCMLAAPALFAAEHHQVSWRKPLLALVTYSPLHLLWAGHEAVVFFFALSGFVLALPYVRGRPTPWGRFVVKRIFRIYVPYAVAVLIAAVLLSAFMSRHGVGAFSDWFNQMWARPVTPKSLGEMLLMVAAPTQNYDTSTWSLIYEMRVSLVFPLLALIVTRARWWVSALLALALFQGSNYVGTNPYLDLSATFYWAAFFMAGAILAAHHEAVSNALRRVRGPLPALLGVAVAVLYLWEWVVVPYVHLPVILGHDLASVSFGDLATLVGALLMMSLALSYERVDRALQRPTLLWLGKVSYSLYLIHPIVLLTLVYGFAGLIPPWVAVLMVPAVSLALSAGYYRFVEAPSMSVGRKLTARPVAAPVGQAS